MAIVGIVGLGGTGCEIIRALLTAFDYVKLSTKQVKLLIVDRDIVSRVNLGRQALYTEKSLDCFKSDVARAFIERRGYQVEAYSTDAARPAFIKKLAVASLIFMCVDNVQTRRKIIPALLLAQRTVIDVGTEGLSGSIRLYAQRYPCFYCTSWMYPSKALPLCTVPGVPRTSEDCIIIAAYSLLEQTANGIDAEHSEGSHDAAVLAVAKSLGEMHNINMDICLGDVTNTLQQIVPTPFYISALVATYAVSLVSKNLLFLLEADRSTFNCDTWPTECFWSISMYNGLFINSLSLQRVQGCSCAFSLPPGEGSGSTYDSIVAVYKSFPDFTIISNERIVYSTTLFSGMRNEGTRTVDNQQIPSRNNLEGSVFIYADGALKYAQWMDYKQCQRE